MGRLLLAAVVWATGQACLAGSLSVAFDASSTEYVVAVDGARQWTEFGGVSYWEPAYEMRWGFYRGGPETSVTYEIPLGFYAQSVSLFARSTVFNWQGASAYVLLDVSADGSSWTTVPTNELVDISGLVHDSTSVWARARLWTNDGPQLAQWLRTEPEMDYSPFALEAVGLTHANPEPQSLVLGCLALVGLLVALRRR